MRPTCMPAFTASSQRAFIAAAVDAGSALLKPLIILICVPCGSRGRVWTSADAGGVGEGFAGESLPPEPPQADSNTVSAA